MRVAPEIVLREDERAKPSQLSHSRMTSVRLLYVRVSCCWQQKGFRTIRLRSSWELAGFRCIALAGTVCATGLGGN